MTPVSFLREGSPGEVLDQQPAPDFAALLSDHDSRYTAKLDEESHTYSVWYPDAPESGVEFDSVTQMLNEARMYPSLTAVDPEVLANAQWRGCAVHTATQYLDTTGLDWSSVGDEEVPMVQAWDSFKYDTGFRPVITERIVANVPYRVAGRLDRAGLLRDDTGAIVDLKTGEIPAAAAIQLALYGWMLDPGYIWHRFAVRLGRGGDPRVVEFPMEEYARDVQVGLSAIACQQWRRRYLKLDRRYRTR